MNPHLLPDHLALLDWDSLLPTPEELTPITQTLIPPHLASAFRILSSSSAAASSSPSASPPLLRTPDPKLHHSPVPHSLPQEDIEEPSTSASASAPLKLEAGLWNAASSSDHLSPQPPPAPYDADSDAPGFLSLAKSPSENGGAWSRGLASAKRVLTEMEIEEAADGCGGGGQENSGGDATAAGRTPKRPRLVWTPQLHKRFVDAVAHLGIKSAVPKTIMQLMNVDGLTRENVASHLQKYRLYLKRMQGLSSDGPTSSDQLFASTPVPPSLASAAHFLAGGGGGDDIPLVALPIPMPISRPHFSTSAAAAPPPPPFLNSYEHHHHQIHPHHSLYTSFVRPHIHHSFLSADPQDCHIDSQHALPLPPPPPPPPSQKQVLTLFPSTGT